MGITTTILLDSIGGTMKESSIIRGGLYTYHGLPENCQGHKYQVLDFITDVPSYQHKVLVECLSGPDEGKKFCCSLDNFNRRYNLISPPKNGADQTKLPETVEGPVAGKCTKGEIVA